MMWQRYELFVNYANTQHRPEPHLLLRACYIRLKSVGRGLFAAEMIGYGERIAAFCTTTGKHLATVGGCHSFAEAVLVNSFTVRGLECSFHCLFCFFDYLQVFSERKFKHLFSNTQILLRIGTLKNMVHDCDNKKIIPSPTT